MNISKRRANIEEETRRKRWRNSSFAKSSKTTKAPTSKANKTCFRRKQASIHAFFPLSLSHVFCKSYRGGNGEDTHVRKWPWLDLPLPCLVRNALVANKMSEKNRAAILELMKQPQNNTCADCGAPSKTLKFMLSSWPTGSVLFDLSLEFSIYFHGDFLYYRRSWMGLSVEGTLHLYHM